MNTDSIGIITLFDARRKKTSPLERRQPTSGLVPPMCDLLLETVGSMYVES